MTASTTDALRVVAVHPDRPDEEVGTIRLVDGKLVFSERSHEAIVRRWRISDVPDEEIFAELEGYGNGAFAIKR